MAVIATKIAQDTNSITDDINRHAIQNALNKLNEGEYDQKIGGVAYSVTAVEVDQREFNAVIPNITGTNVAYSVIPYTGKLTKIYSVNSGTTTQSGSTYGFGVSLVGFRKYDICWGFREYGGDRG